DAARCRLRHHDCSGGTGPIPSSRSTLLSWDAGSFTATIAINGATALADGLYRLLICGTIEDEVGNALDGGAGAGSDFLRTFRIDADNLLADGHFDDFDPAACTLDAWVSSDPSQVELADPDVDASPLSGSAHNTIAASQGFDLAQCVSLEEGRRYVLEAALRVDESNGEAIVPELFCELFDAAACGGTSLGTASLQDEATDTAGVWVQLGFVFQTPAGTVSGMCGVAVQPGVSIGFDAFLDDVFLGNGDIFADGFESGDTAAWSATAGR
ncbi:MAG: hypothetical protein HC897_15875, partial [Thermoanaerobaculia bacterium]|nr:hypothetical protein [Thermoanaerobaculia bacterium]